MISTPPYILPWTFFFIVLGAVWFLLDRSIGVSLYRWWYNMTHEHPLADDERKGFIHQRKAKARLITAIVLALVQSVIVMAITRKGLLMEFLSFFLEVPATMIGFYIGPGLAKIWGKKDTVLDKVDELESGKTSVARELKEVSHATAEKVKDLFQGEEDEAEEKPAIPESEPAPAPEPEPEPEPDPRELMSKYLRKDDERND